MSSASCDPTSQAGQPITLSALQHAWLVETGLDPRFLAQWQPQVTQSVSARPESPAAAVAREAAPAAEPAPKPRVLGSLPADLVGLERDAAVCQACDLHRQRHQIVFGAGDTTSPEWLIVGEAPGKADDRSGLPFQGKAGQLLHAMLVSVGVYPPSLALGGAGQPTPAWCQPTTAYFTSLVKCRPLGNHSPEASQIAACVPYLQAQIDQLQPQRILVLGRLAAQALLQTEDDLPELRGQVHHITASSGKQIPLVATWHPASLLVHPQHKPQAWGDLSLARQLTS